MTVEELMKPRYKVIADYPNTNFTKNEVVEFNDLDYQGRIVFYIYDDYGPTQLSPSFFNEYPHLFKRLLWWEERKPEDRPEYVKHVSGKVFKAYELKMQWGGRHAFFSTDEWEETESYLKEECLPATLEEYNNFKNTP